MTHEQLLAKTLEDMRGMMYYKTSKTLRENFEMNKRPPILMGEQIYDIIGPGSMYDLATRTGASNAEVRAAKSKAMSTITGGVFDPLGDAIESGIINAAQWTKEVFEDWDHDTALKLDLGLTLGGLALMQVGGPVGVVVGGVMVIGGTLIGVADAAVYISEGEYTTGGIFLAMQLVPGLKIIRALRGGGELAMAFAKVGQVVTWDNIFKVIKNPKIWGPEVYKAVVKAGVKFGKMFSKEILMNGIKLFKQKISEYTIKGTALKTLTYMLKTGIWAGKTVLHFTGIAISVDVLMWLLSLQSETIRKSRETDSMSLLLQELYKLPYYGVKSLIRQNPQTLQYEPVREFADFLDRLYGFDGSVNEPFVAEEVIKNINSIDFNKVNFEQNSEYYQNMMAAVEGEYENIHNTGARVSDMLLQQYEEMSPTVLNANTATIDDVLNRKYEIKPDSAGEIVEDIQKILKMLGYDLGDSGPNKDGVDGIYGGRTLISVINFQSDNGLSAVDGIIGHRTMSKLIEKVKPLATVNDRVKI